MNRPILKFESIKMEGKGDNIKTVLRIKNHGDREAINIRLFQTQFELIKKYYNEASSFCGLSADKIYQVIKEHSPNADTICDLFCGGFAISDYFLKNGWSVIANDKNKYVIALIDQIINKTLDEKRCLEFVTREMFYDVTNITSTLYKYNNKFFLICQIPEVKNNSFFIIKETISYNRAFKTLNKVFTLLP